jgi:hypothetical protein
VAAITDNLGDPTGSDAQAPDPQIPTLDDANTQFSEYEVEFKLKTGETTQFTEQPDPIEPILTQLKPIGDATFTEWFVTLKDLMGESEDLAEFRERLIDSYPDLDAAEFKQAMLDASTVAGMQGYFDASDGELSFSMSDEEVEFKIPEGTTKVKNGKTYVLANSRWRSEDSDESRSSVSKIESEVGALVKKSVMTENTDEDFDDATRKQKWGAELSTLDINQVTYLPKVGENKWDATIEKLKALPEGHVVAFHPDDSDLFLDLFVKSATSAEGDKYPVAKIKGGKFASVFEDQKAVAAIREARAKAASNMQDIHFDEDENVRATKGMSKSTIAAGRTINGETFPYGKPISAREKKAILELEDEQHVKIDELENTYLGRKPTGKHGDYNDYAAKAEKWANDKFGDFAQGANGFSLAQTKAHDIAHPVTHDLLGMNSDQIHARLGKMTDANGANALYGEEAIVNVMEQMSRGVSIEAAVLNGVRLARVMTRGGIGSAEATKYVRSPEFAKELGSLASKAYRNNDFAPLIAHVRQSNRISGTVMAAGDNFASSASGG